MSITEHIVSDLHHIMGSDCVSESSDDGVHLVSPKGVEEVSAVFKWANRHGVVVSVSRRKVEIDAPHVRVDWTRMANVMELDPTSMIVQVESGMTTAKLEKYLEPLGFTTGFDPGWARDLPLGVIIAHRVANFSSPTYGTIEQLCIKLSAVLPNGTIMKTPLAPRRATGSDLRAMMMGTGGRLGVVTSIALRIFPRFPRKRYFGVHFATEEMGLEAIRLLLRHDLRPLSLGLWHLEADAGAALAQGMPDHGVVVIGACGLGVPGAEKESQMIERRLHEMGTSVLDLDLEALWRAFTDFAGGRILELCASWPHLGRAYATVAALVSADSPSVITQFSKYGGLARWHVAPGAELDAEALAALRLETGCSLRAECLPASEFDRRLKDVLDPKGLLHA